MRFCPLTAEEAQAVPNARGTGRHAIRYIEMPDPLHDDRPDSTVPLFAPDGAGGIRTATLSWGFPLDGKPHAVFNTRIESALEQLPRGRGGMWAKAITKDRCLVPVRAFYESSATEKVISERTGKPVRRQYCFHPQAPVHSYSPPSRRRGFCPSSPSCPTPASPRSTIACLSYWVRGSRVCG